MRQILFLATLFLGMVSAYSTETTHVDCYLSPNKLVKVTKNIQTDTLQVTELSLDNQSVRKLYENKASEVSDLWHAQGRTVLLHHDHKLTYDDGHQTRTIFDLGNGAPHHIHILYFDGNYLYYSAEPTHSFYIDLFCYDLTTGSKKPIGMHTLAPHERRQILNRNLEEQHHLQYQLKARDLLGGEKFQQIYHRDDDHLEIDDAHKLLEFQKIYEQLYGEDEHIRYFSGDFPLVIQGKAEKTTVAGHHYLVMSDAEDRGVKFSMVRVYCVAPQNQRITVVKEWTMTDLFEKAGAQFNHPVLHGGNLYYTRDGISKHSSLYRLNILTGKNKLIKKSTKGDILHFGIHPDGRSSYVVTGTLEKPVMTEYRGLFQKKLSKTPGRYKISYTLDDPHLRLYDVREPSQPSKWVVFKDDQEMAVLS